VKKEKRQTAPPFVHFQVNIADPDRFDISGCCRSHALSPIPNFLCDTLS
jgi:hypothetical protein